MAQEDPDVAGLFAPLRPAQAFDVMLSEARQVLTHVSKPVDAELWGSDMIGALSRPASVDSSQAPGGSQAAHGAQGAGGAEGADVMTELTAALVPAAERNGTPEALALLRILAAIGSPRLQEAAAEAAARVVARGVPDPAWAARIGRPTIGKCWHYSDIGGRQESVTACFGYDGAEHALSVLIDHGNGGKIKDAWVTDADGLLDKTWLAAESDPLVVFEQLDADDAGARLAKAVTRGECPAKPDEADDLAAHRALLHARLRYLATI